MEEQLKGKPISKSKEKSTNPKLEEAEPSQIEKRTLMDAYGEDEKIDLVSNNNGKKKKKNSDTFVKNNEKNYHLIEIDS